MSCDLAYGGRGRTGMSSSCRVRLCAVTVIAAAAAVSAMAPLLAQAVAWPSKTVRVIVPFAPGSATDLLPRTVFERVAANLGQTFLIENRTGGGTTVGTAAVAKSDPDGHTVLVHSNALVTTPAIQANSPYDPVQDFAGITPLGNVPLVLVISPDRNIKTLKELVAAAKAKPGTLNYAAAAIGTPPQSDHGALPPSRRLHRPAGSVHRRAAGAHRDSGRARRRLFLSDHAGAAVHPRRQAAGAGGEQLQARLG